MSDEQPTLERRIGLAGLVVYGVGDMLGSGVYALVGKVAGTMGTAVFLAFLGSFAAALLTALSYASIGSRHPRAAGVAYVADRAFGKPFLSYVLGLAMVASGLTSMATQSRAFSGYFLGLLGLEASPATTVTVILGFLAALTIVNLRGIRESVALNALCTLVEVSGLLLVIAVSVPHWGSVDLLVPPAGATLGPSLFLQGALLTFYAFIGFEDMLNVTEEVKDPKRTFPLAVLLAVSIAAAVYVAIGISAVSVVAPADLAGSGQPLVDVVRRAAPWFPPGAFSVIALFAITNTALLNFVMGSRLVYGLSRQALLPAALGAIHPTRRTPHVAILALLAIVVVLALAGDIAQLASATSVLLLGSFAVVHAALLALRRRPDEPKGAFEVPAVVPVAGIAVCAALLTQAKPAALLIAGALVGGIALLYVVTRRATRPRP